MIAADQTTKIMKWLTEHPIEAEILIGSKEPHKVRDLYNLILDIEEQELYELLPVLLENGRYNSLVGEIYAELAIQMVHVGWNELGTEKVVQMLKEIIQEYIRQGADD